MTQRAGADCADLAGRIALVTGASRGIGAAVAKRLTSAGASVVLTASPRSAQALGKVAAQLREAGASAAVVEADLAETQGVATLVEQATAAFGRVDILVNNAAAIPAFAPPSRIDRPGRETTFAINLQAPIDLMQALLPAMREQAWGRIVNISSDTARQPPIPYPGPAEMVHKLALYGVSKAALERYSSALAAELHGSGVHVNVVYPSRIAHTEGADKVVQAMRTTRPEWIEPVEMMAEAVYCAIAMPLTGVVKSSRELLAMLQQPLHALDGYTEIGDAMYVAS